MWNIYLVFVRLWLGISMIQGGQSILRFFHSQELRDFFQHWFGNEIGFPMPLLMAFLAKGTEFLGGILICMGIFTRISASLIGFVMFIATIFVNIKYSAIVHIITSEGNVAFSGKDAFLLPDGHITLSALLFSCLLIFSGAGKFSLDSLIFKNKLKWI